MAHTDFLRGMGKKKGTLARVLAPKRALYHVLTSQGGSLVCFANQEGTLACFFGSQEGTLVCTSLSFNIICHPESLGFRCVLTIKMVWGSSLKRVSSETQNRVLFLQIEAYTHPTSHPQILKVKQARGRNQCAQKPETREVRHCLQCGCM